MTASMTHEQARKAVEQYFVRGLAPAKATAMYGHVESCERCRAAYRRWTLLAPLDRKMLPAEERVARGLGLHLARPRQALRLGGSLGLAVAFAACLLVVRPWHGSGVVAGDGDAPAGYASRGEAHAAKLRLLVYRTNGGAPELLGREMKRDDELAFAYVNPTNKPFLAIFATDESGRVYWYHPAWRLGQEAPKSIVTARGTTVHELKESVRHAFEGKRITLSAILSERPLDVRAIEQALAQGAPVSSVDPSASLDFERKVELLP